MAKERYVLCLGQQLHSRLHAEAELDSRHLREQVLYLLEVMTTVAIQFPELRLTPELKDTSSHNLGVRLEMSDWLDDQIFHMCGSYGLTKQQLLRTLLWMGLEAREKFAPKGQNLRKEDFVVLVSDKLRQSTNVH